MKKLITLVGFFPWILINGQDIDFSQFSEERMNEVMLINLNYYIKSQGGDSVIRSFNAQKKIHWCMKRYNEKLTLDSLGTKINNEILTKFDTPTNMSVGIFDRIPWQDIKTYQDIALMCITDWKNSPSDAFFMTGWGNEVEVISYYNKRTNSIYVSLVYHTQ